jgi:hypothetical protein
MSTHRPLPSFAWLIALATFFLMLSAAPAQSQDMGARASEALVIDGGRLSPFLGGEPQAIEVWVWRDEAWSRIPAQVDERDLDGLYLADGVEGSFDAGDELAFMLADHGAEAPDDSRPDSIAADAPSAAVQAVDPLDAELAAWFYIYLASEVSPSPGEPYVSYDGATRTLKGERYALGMADPNTDGFIGLRSLSLDDGPDLIDRLKIRGTLDLLGNLQPVTEEDLGPLLAAAGAEIGGEPVKTGPVRSVLTGAGGFAYARRFDLLGGFDTLRELGGGFIVFTDARISLDLDPAASGATYRDANVTLGVPVDGMPDEVPQGPLPAWRELVFGNARLAMLNPPSSASVDAQVYYMDNADNPEAGDTGDGKQFADMGVAAPDFENLVDSGFPGELVVLPADAGDEGVTGLAAAQEAALELRINLAGSAPTQVPTQVPTSMPTTPPEDTPTPGVEPTDAPGEGGPPILIPYIANGS